MSRYIAVIDFEDGKYGAHFPDAPGCTAMGETREEAVADAGDALSEWLAHELSEGREPPRVRTRTELLDAGELGSDSTG